MGRAWGTLSLRQRAGVALAVWAVAFSILAVASALPTGPKAVLSVDDATPIPGQLVRFDASASEGHDQGLGRIVAYRFDFGDGTGTGEQASPTTTHAYAAEGRVRATVSVRDARGLAGSASVDLDVRRIGPPTGPAPDLVPLAATTIPARPMVGDIVTVSVTVVNHGGSTAESATVDVFDDRPDGSSVRVSHVNLPEPLNAGASLAILSEAFLAVGVGEHTLRIVVGNVTPPETFQADNTFVLRMTVRPAAVPPPPDGEFVLRDAALVAGFAGAAVAALFGAALLLLRPRTPGPREPPPPEPTDRSPPPIWPP